MTGAILLLVVLAAAALLFVAAPLWRRGSAAENAADRMAVQGLRELHARQQMLLAALKDLEDDRATDKLDEADYEQLKQRLSTQAMDVMRQLDDAEQQREKILEHERLASKPLRHPGPRRSGPSP